MQSIKTNTPYSVGTNLAPGRCGRTTGGRGICADVIATFIVIFAFRIAIYLTRSRENREIPTSDYLRAPVPERQPRDLLLRRREPALLHVVI